MKLYTFLFFAIFFALLFQSNQSYSQWVKTNGADSGYVNCFAVSPNNSGGLNIFAGGYGGIFLSNDNGANWSLVNNGLLTTDVFAIAASAPGTGDTSVFVVTLGAYRSTSNVINWSRIYFGMALTLVTNFNIDGYTNLFIGTQEEGIKISTDNGANWSEANNGLTNPVVRLLAKTSNGENLFASTDGGFFLSTNNGASWTAINNGLTNPTVLALANIDTNLFAGTDGGGLFLSVDNGMNWNEVNTGIADAQVTSLAASGSNLFAVMNSKVYLTTNNGTSWTNINTGLENSYVDVILTNGEYVFAGTYGDGIWRRSLSEIITSTEQIYSHIPEKLVLNQNYPNPFNPSTVISYQLPVSSNVTLKVFDVLGNEIATLVDEEKPAGSYEVEFNPVSHSRESGNLSSGVYFYQLKAGNYFETKKMIMLK